MKSSAREHFAGNSHSKAFQLLQRLESPERGVQVWSAHLDTASSAEIVELTGLVDPGESARAARFHFERDRRHYLVARGLLRLLIGTALDRPASTIAFDYRVNGKPTIAAADMDDCVLHFNLSHSAGWAMFALAWDQNVGIDLESAQQLTRTMQELSALAERTLSTRELNIWHGLPNDVARSDAFLRAWTRKEACIKATGEGLRDKLQEIEVALDAANPKRSLTLSCFSRGKKSIRNWTLYDLPSPHGFAAALAIEAP